MNPWQSFGASRRSLVLALGAAPLAALAKPGVDEPPVPGEPRPLVVPTLSEHALPNGVRVVLAPRRGLPLVTVALHLGLGSAADPDGKAGLASLTASMRTKGARLQGRSLSATELAQAAEGLGATLESGASWQGSSLSMTVARTQLSPALGLVAAAALEPTLDGKELQRLREQTADGLKFALSDPMALAGLVARRAAWGASVYGGSLTLDSLQRIGVEDVQAFHQELLHPSRATLVLSGDVDEASALALARRWLGFWRPHRRALAQARSEPPKPVAPATVLVNLPGAGQCGVLVQAPQVAANSTERRVAQVATAVLGGGYSARLNTEVRIKRGLSYGASASAEMQPVGGWLTASTQTQHRTAAEVVQLMRAELRGLGANPPSAEELAARQATLVGGFARRLETTAGLAAVVLEQVERQRPLADLGRFAPEILAVTPKEVAEFAQRHWADAALRTVVVGDLAAAGEDLRRLDPDPLVLEAAALKLDAPGLQ